MASYYNFYLTLTQEGASSGPYYVITYRTGSIYMPVVEGSPAYLPNVGDKVLVTVESSSYIQFKLTQGTGAECEICNNAFTYVATGSAAYTIAACTGSTKYNVTLYSTQPYDIGDAISGSLFPSGCYYISSSYSGALDFETASVDVYTNCLTCRYGYPPYKWYASRNFPTAFDACVGQLNEQTLWSNLPYLENNVTYMYTDPALTIPFNGLFNAYSRTGISADNSWAAAETDATGKITGVTIC